jgi:hypothetical protein
LRIEPEASPEDDTDSDMLRDCGLWLKRGIHLAVMPIARVTLDVPIKFGEGVFMYPACIADLNALNIVPNDEKTSSLACPCGCRSVLHMNLLPDERPC